MLSVHAAASCCIMLLTLLLELSPIDYLLFYKRAMAYMSLSRHPQALDDFESVIKLSKGSVDRAYLMKGQIYVKEAMWKEAREAVLKLKTKEDKDTQNLVSRWLPL